MTELWFFGPLFRQWILDYFQVFVIVNRANYYKRVLCVSWATCQKVLLGSMQAVELLGHNEHECSTL